MAILCQGDNHLLFLRITDEHGAGDGARTRNFQLGNLNYHSFIFTTYKTALEKSTCMQRIPVHAVPDLRIAGGRLGEGFHHT